MYFNPSLNRLQTLTPNLLQTLTKSAPTSPTKFTFSWPLMIFSFLVCLCIFATCMCAHVCVCVADGSVSQGAGAVLQRSTDLAGAPGGGSQTGGKPQGGGLPGEQGLTYTLKDNDLFVDSVRF